MQAIWKYELSVVDYQELEMPWVYKCLSVQLQYGRICLWALVSTDKQSKTKRGFRIYGTGHEHQEIEGEYIGTVVVEDTASVWHVFTSPIPV